MFFLPTLRPVAASVAALAPQGCTVGRNMFNDLKL